LKIAGGWTGPAIRVLAPFWSTDVAGDFIAAGCPKVVANDSSDAIIADPSSLKAGISLFKEIRRGVSTSRLGWNTEAPLTYRMADWENVGVNGKILHIVIILYIHNFDCILSSLLFIALTYQQNRSMSSRSL
jgi:hypothetical protein